MATAAETCIGCNQRQRGCNGRCPCLADPERRDILVHIDNANRGEPTCPLHKHDNVDPDTPAPPPTPIPAAPRPDWPPHAENLAAFALPGEPGLGTVCHRIIEAGTDKRALAAVAEFLAGEYGLMLVIIQGTKWLLSKIGFEGQECSGCEIRAAESDAKYPLYQSGETR